jgi:hypothetical protein
MNQTSKKSSGSLTIWSRNETELVPGRLRNILRIVMPIIYGIMASYGISSMIFPSQTFITVVGLNFGYLWAGLIGIFSTISLVALIFKLKLELYSVIILSTLLLIYPIYILVLLFNDPIRGGVTHINVLFVAFLYLVMPVWRALDISLDIRKSQRRQLYAESARGKDVE